MSDSDKTEPDYAGREIRSAADVWIDENLEEAAEMQAAWFRGEYATSSVRFLWVAERAFQAALDERDPKQELEAEVFSREGR